MLHCAGSGAHLFAITKSGVEDDELILHVRGRHGRKMKQGVYYTLFKASLQSESSLFSPLSAYVQVCATDLENGVTDRTTVTSLTRLS